MVRVSTMMLGELDFLNTCEYQSTCIDLNGLVLRQEECLMSLFMPFLLSASLVLRPMITGHKDLHIWRQSVASVSFLIIFAILMPILLMNLLIGLAVGDIDTVRRNASMKRLAMQIQHHTDLVNLLSLCLPCPNILNRSFPSLHESTDHLHPPFHARRDEYRSRC